MSKNYIKEYYIKEKNVKKKKRDRKQNKTPGLSKSITKDLINERRFKYETKIGDFLSDYNCEHGCKNDSCYEYHNCCYHSFEGLGEHKGRSCGGERYCFTCWYYIQTTLEEEEEEDSELNVCHSPLTFVKSVVQSNSGGGGGANNYFL